MDNLQWLSCWYQVFCDREREHLYGIDIETIDNPGWSIKIALNDTTLSHKCFAPIEREWETGHWLTCYVHNDCFIGFCGLQDLNELLSIFRKWADQERAVC